jgi:hypothetical protein
LIALHGAKERFQNASADVTPGCRRARIFSEFQGRREPRLRWAACGKTVENTPVFINRCPKIDQRIKRLSWLKEIVNKP